MLWRRRCSGGGAGATCGGGAAIADGAPAPGVGGQTGSASCGSALSSLGVASSVEGCGVCGAWARTPIGAAARVTRVAHVFQKHFTARLFILRPPFVKATSLSATAQ